MGTIEFNSENCLALLRKQFPDTWKALLWEARKMITAQRRQMKGIVTVEQAATACIMRNKPALSVMAASGIMARQEKLLLRHIALEMVTNRLMDRTEELSYTMGDRYRRTGIAERYNGRIEANLKEIAWILMEIKELALTMGEKPIVPEKGYCPWHGRGFLNA